MTPVPQMSEDDHSDEPVESNAPAGPEIRRVGRAYIRLDPTTKGSFRLTITDAVEHAGGDDQHGVIYDVGATDDLGLTPAAVIPDDSPEMQSRHAYRIVVAGDGGSYQVRAPREMFDRLGYDVDEIRAAAERDEPEQVDVYAGEGLVAFARPDRQRLNWSPEQVAVEDAERELTYEDVAAAVEEDCLDRLDATGDAVVTVTVHDLADATGIPERPIGQLLSNVRSGREGTVLESLRVWKTEDVTDAGLRVWAVSRSDD